MSAPPLPREDEIFETARLLVEPKERQAYLVQVCGGDAALLERLGALLAAAGEADAFFAESTTAVRGSAVGSSLRSATPSSARPDWGEEPLGTRIGRYKLLQKLGEGGCGVVYLAEQEEPVRRHVALKIIKLGMETKSVIARFEAERQALALMDHPHIARVYDAGATDRGSPYFVMEWVSGVRITEYCDRHQLTLPQRLELFIQICHAIQHAHQKGVIHGDIKPSNILVSQQDDAPSPKVIDFGIARATEPRLTDHTRFTGCAQLIGTPAYMSPEQADLRTRDVDTRSDIYSLGVLLYELLTGRTPFASKELLEGGLEAMRRLLLEQEPLRPSARFSSLPDDERAQTASLRRLEPQRLSQRLVGDLDWIVMKALEKDRARRYETANGLAMDIRRYLDHEPVLAGPASWTYRLGKLVRRNRGVFFAAGAVAVTLCAGFGTSTWLFLKERESHRRAVAAEQQQARLRLAAETREKIAQAALLVSQENYGAADELVRGIALDEPTMEGAAVFRALGGWHALQNRWAEAVERFNVVLRVNQLDNTDVATLDHLETGPTLIELGDRAAYQAFRLAALERFANPTSTSADRVLKICLLRPADAALLERLRPVAVATTEAHEQAVRNGDLFQAAWRSLSLALWAYRSGHDADALEWGRRCLDCPEANAPRVATARLVLALTLFRSGRLDAARAELAQAREAIDTKFRQQLDKGTPVQGFWFDWVFARILLRETEQAVR